MVSPACGPEAPESKCENDLLDAQLQSAPSPGETSRARYEQIVHAHRYDAPGNHWFGCEVGHDTDVAGVRELPVGEEGGPGWREDSLQDLAPRTGTHLVTRDAEWQPQTRPPVSLDPPVGFACDMS